MRSTRTLFSAAACALAMIVLAGCASDDRRSEVPTNATLATSGNSKLSYTAATDGTVWVYDVHNDRIVYSGPIMRGDSVVVDPDRNTVTIGGRTVAERSLAPGTMTRVFF
jgi:ABC-type Fe3+-hydroxamate transport system substrate-binding protein